MADVKSACHDEKAMEEGHEVRRHTQSQIRYEEEPKVDYRIGWKTWAAVFALSLLTAAP
jgi:hypothetical protein